MGETEWEKLGLALLGRILLSKALIQLSADGWGCTTSLVVVCLRLYYRVNGEFLENLHQRGPSQTATASAPIPVVSLCQPKPPQFTL